MSNINHNNMNHMKNSMKSAALLVSAVLMLSLGGCYKDSFCLRGNGHPEIEVRDLNAFDEVVNNGSFDVTIVPADYYEVEVDAESNLLPYIQTTVAGRKLYIETVGNRCINNTMSMMVTVYTPYVDGVELNGSGTVVADNLYLDALKVQLTGSGNMDFGNLDVLSLEASISGSGRLGFSGIADESELNISGSGNIEAYSLQQLRCFTTTSGSGNMYVRVSNLLDVVISGSGNVYYRGNPSVQSRITGSGRVIRQ